MRLRWALLLALAAATLAGAWWLLQVGPPSHPGQAGLYPVSIVAPDGALWWNGTVALGDGATALVALQAAAAQGHFTLDVAAQPMGAYVRAIGPFSETAGGGWNYCIDGGAGYAWVGIAADRRGLAPGESVQWRWAEGGSEVC